MLSYRQKFFLVAMFVIVALCLSLGLGLGLGLPASGIIGNPIVESTVLPTTESTFTPTPSPFPTQFPTLTPTMLPTMSPTQFPTLTPTVVPTVVPTLTPTQFPTLTPTMLPTQFPTMLPTMLPTMSPTQFPTLTPTLTPTVVPTLTPNQTNVYNLMNTNNIPYKMNIFAKNPETFELYTENFTTGILKDMNIPLNCGEGMCESNMPYAYVLTDLTSQQLVNIENEFINRNKNNPDFSRNTDDLSILYITSEGDLGRTIYFVQKVDNIPEDTYDPTEPGMNTMFLVGKSSSMYSVQ